MPSSPCGSLGDDAPDHVLRVTSLAGVSMPTFWIALVALYLGFFRLGWFPGAERLDPGTNPPPRHGCGAIGGLQRQDGADQAGG